MSMSVVGLVVNALADNGHVGGSFSGTTLFVTCPAVVNLMRKLVFHAQNCVKKTDAHRLPITTSLALEWSIWWEKCFFAHQQRLPEEDKWIAQDCRQKYLLTIPITNSVKGLPLHF